MRKVAAGGSRFVLEARLANMKKFVSIIVAYSVMNPLLYLLAIGAGVGTLINRSSGGIDGVEYLVFWHLHYLRTQQFKVLWMKLSFLL